MMKKSTLLALMLALLTAFSFSSCDKDAHKAWKLAGEWEGDMGMYVEVVNTENKEAKPERFYASHTVIRFEQEGRYGGWGEEVNYFNEGPIDWTYHSFDWEFQHGRLYLFYHEEHALDVVIDNYKLKNSKFYGMIGNYEFYLSNIDHYNWDLYDPYWLTGFTYWDTTYYDYYYGKSRDLGGENAKPEDLIVIHGSRYMEGAQESEESK